MGITLTSENEKLMHLIAFFFPIKMPKAHFIKVLRQFPSDKHQKRMLIKIGKHFALHNYIGQHGSAELLIGSTCLFFALWCTREAKQNQTNL